MNASTIRLAFYLARTELATRQATSAGGLAWTFLGPLASILVIWLALDLGLGLRATMGPDYGRSLAVGLVAWLFFSEAVASCAGTISGSPHLVKKIVFPVQLLPLSVVLVRLAVHAVVIVAIIGLLAWGGAAPGWHLLLLPPAMLLLAAFSYACGLLVATLNVAYRDTQSVVMLLMGLLFWLTPIIWPVANVPDAWQPLVYLNPLAAFVELYRSAVLGTPLPGSLATLLPGMAAVAALSVATRLLFVRLRPVFADVL